MLLHHLLHRLKWLLTALVIILISSQPLPVQGHNILAAFPHMGMSHWLFFRPIVTELVRRNHNVTLLSYFGIDDADMKSQPNYHEYLFKRDRFLTNTFDLQHYTPNFYRAIFHSIGHLSAWGNSACDLLLNNDRTDEILKRGEQFDLLLTETFHTDCAIGLAFKLANNPPVVGLSSCVVMPYFYQRFGLPDSPSFIPSEYVGYSEKMSLPERVVNYAVTRTMQVLYDYYQSQPDNEMLRRKFGADFPDIRVLAKNMSLMLVNQHYSMAGARPSPPNVLELAGVHVMGIKENILSEELQQLLVRSSQGVILMSFGSIVRLSSLPAEKRIMLMNVFGRLDQTVLMKWENNSAVVENKPDNVHLLNWLPQREILAHPNVKVFFSHGGMMGLVEAMINKVPVLGTPMYGDQYLNVATIDNRKAGLRLNYVDWTEESLMDAIQKCLSKEYQDNAAMIAFYMAQRDPLDLGVTAIENVIATKGFKLAQPYSIELSWFAYHSFDAVLILLSPIILCFIGFIYYSKKIKNGAMKGSKNKRE